MRPPSDGSGELRRFTGPILGSLEVGLNYMGWGVLLMFAAYFLSGFVVVASDEVAVVLRFGGFAGGTPATALRQPGLHFTLPSPIDEVIRVKVEKIYELDVSGLHFRRPGGAADQIELTGANGLREPVRPARGTGVIRTGGIPRRTPQNRFPARTSDDGTTIDPVVEGYALTGDRNIVQIDMVARYQIEDPVAFALHQAEPEQLLRDSIMAAAVRSMGDAEVDSLLSDGRSQFQIQVVQRAQAGLQETGAGIALVSLEIIELAPPRHVRSEFEQVQNAFIEMETKLKGANKEREEALPRAKAERNTAVRAAESYATELLAEVRGDARMWRDLYAEYRKNPRVVRERMYLEAMEDSLPNAGRRRWVPPPTGSRYSEFRLTIPASPRGIQ
ncbi:MAG: protease modulator HflK [Myxococcota bacterium]